MKRSIGSDGRGDHVGDDAVLDAEARCANVSRGAKRSGGPPQDLLGRLRLELLRRRQFASSTRCVDLVRDSCQQLLERLADRFDRLGVVTPRRAPARASRSAALGRAAPTCALVATASAIMPAPAVKFVAGSIRMKLPVPRFSA